MEYLETASSQEERLRVYDVQEKKKESKGRKEAESLEVRLRETLKKIGKKAVGMVSHLSEKAVKDWSSFRYSLIDSKIKKEGSMLRDDHLLVKV